MSLEIPAEKRLIRKLEAVGYFLYVKSVDSSNTFISSMTCLSMMFFAVSPIIGKTKSTNFPNEKYKKRRSNTL